MVLATSLGRRCACCTSFSPRALHKRGPASKVSKSGSNAQRLALTRRGGGVKQRAFLNEVVSSSTVTATLASASEPGVGGVSGSDALAGGLFAVSLFPYLAFLYYCFKTKQTPRLVSVGFATLLIFVFVTAPAGIYAQKVYGTSLSNVDWLHGSAESFLFFTNLLIVVALRRGIREAEEESKRGRNKEREANTADS